MVQQTGSTSLTESFLRMSCQRRTSTQWNSRNSQASRPPRFTCVETTVRSGPACDGTPGDNKKLHLAGGAAKVDGGQVLWQAGVVEEDIGLCNLLRQDARHSQHGPAAVHQLRLPVPVHRTERKGASRRRYQDSGVRAASGLTM